MAKEKTVYVCSNCGQESPKWVGKCPSCGEWNTYVEEIVRKETTNRRPVSGIETQKAKPVILSEIEADDEPRINMHDDELNRVLGGGLVPGSLVLIGGEPGIGKSTLVMQTVLRMPDKKILYVSGEESAGQVAMRAKRLELRPDGIRLMSEIQLETIEQVIVAEKPDFVVIDSIQTIFSSELNSAPGSVSQVRECAARLTRLAKTSGTTLVFVGHVTKEGSLAGPRVLEHIVDTVLYFEGDTHSNFRLIRAFKNRFGAVNELGVFGMTDHGLRGVSNPSAIFLSEYRESVPGSVILVTQEGTRPLLVEIQALVDDSHSPTPKRLSVGLDLQRLSMLLAVLHRHAGVSCFDQDVFVNAVGGMKISEPATDLAVLLAIISSIRNRALPKGLVVFGEIGLAGEVRPAPRGQERLREAAKLGFSRAIIPRANKPKEPIEGLEVIPVDKLSEAVAAVQGME